MRGNCLTRIETRSGPAVLPDTRAASVAGRPAQRGAAGRYGGRLSVGGLSAGHPGGTEVDSAQADSVQRARAIGRLGAGRRPELAEDRRDVYARGLAADEEPLADLPVAETLGDELEHLSLARGELGGGG